MLARVLPAFLIVFVLCVADGADAAKQKTRYVPGHVLVKRRPGVQASALTSKHSQLQARIIKRFNHPKGLELVAIPSNKSVAEALSLYQDDPNVLYAEPDYIVHATEIPNDPQFGQQWALNNSSDSDINAPEAWNLTKGDPSVVIAIIDTGISYDHPDLQGNMWKNNKESAGNNTDEDNNGYVDDIYGINVVTRTGDPLDDNGHGTHVAGIIAGHGNDGVGISGVNQRASLLSCKFLDESGSGNTSDAILCLQYISTLVDRGVNIVASNNSWAGGDASQALLDAIEDQKEKGVLFIAAASNEGEDNDLVDTYPANFSAANLISVAATDRDDSLADFSNYGRRSVHVAAPGVDILSSFLNNDYETLSGTSMATPHVAGLAGLLKAYNPALDWKKIKNLILSSGTSINGAAKTISGRRIRAADVNGVGALTCSNQVVTSRLSPKLDAITIPLGTPLPLAALNINCADPNGVPDITLQDGSTLILSDDGHDTDDAASDGIYSANWSPSTPGSYALNFFGSETVQVSVFDSSSWFSYRRANTTPYNYRSIGGTAMHAGDDVMGVVAAPFPIRFAGDNKGFQTLFVSSNGVISVVDSLVAPFNNASLPDSRFVTAIAPFWDDLVPGSLGSGDIYYDAIGDAPKREFVIEWRNVMQYDAKTPVTFQVVFFENSADILFNYQNTDLNDDSLDAGASATIGIQVATDKAAQASFNQPAAASGTAMRFTRNQKPTANAGTDFIVSADQQFSLNGSLSSDPDGDNTLSYSWQQIGGDQVFIANPGSAQPSVTAGGVPDTLTFELVVTDDGGEVSNSDVHVTVVQSNNDNPGAGSETGATAPTIALPKMGAVVDVRTPNLAINNAPNPNGGRLNYDFEISKNQDFSDPLQKFSHVPEGTAGATVVWTDNLQDGQSYFWRARTVNGENTSDWVSADFLVKLPASPNLNTANGVQFGKGSGSVFSCSSNPNTNMSALSPFFALLMLTHLIARQRRSIK